MVFVDRADGPKEGGLEVVPPEEGESVFGERIQAERNSVFGLNPTWGVSELRDKTTTEGTGASVAESNGAIVVSTGTATDNVAELQTLRRGVYVAQTVAEAGVKVRLPSSPTGSQDAKWGYFDANNGFGFGVDSTGKYVFIRKDGSDTVIRQGDWNQDPLNGNGPSGVTIDYADGVIFQIRFTFYGNGTIEFHVVVDHEGDDRRETYVVHRENVTGDLSITDPNQPITVRAVNGSNTDTNLDVHVGGRGFSRIGGDTETRTRTLSDSTPEGVGLPGNGSWTALMAVRRKGTHGPSGRKNSVNVEVTEFEVLSDQDTEARLTFGGSLASGTWETPDRWARGETAVEVKRQAGTLDIGTPGFPFQRGLISGGEKKTSRVEDEKSRQVLAGSKQAILQARDLSGNGATAHGIIEWTEEW